MKVEGSISTGSCIETSSKALDTDAIKLGFIKDGPDDGPIHQRVSKSTGSRTSITRKYFASAGYFAATASYIANATLR